MKSKPILVKSDHSGQQLEPIDPSRNTYSESWLQELIQENPQILPADEIEPVFWPLVPIGREIPTRSGPIDNLLISESGYPVLVETKLWRNSEAKREVIAQALDYAGELSRWSFDDLEKATQLRNNKGVLGLIQDAFDTEKERMPTEDDISRNLRLGRILILIVSDHIRESLIEMLDYVNKSPHLATNVGLVEIQCYHLPDADGDILAVPSIVAKTAIIERSIVQVTLSPDQPHTIDVQQTRRDKGNSRMRTTLTEEAFWEGLNRTSSQSTLSMRKITEHYKNNPYVYFGLRETSIVAEIQCPESNQFVSVFILGQNGTVTVWPDTLLNHLRKGSLDVKIGTTYLSKIEGVLLKKTKNRRLFSLAEKINLDEFFTVADDFIQQVASAIPNNEDQT